jgi:predicted ATPase
LPFPTLVRASTSKPSPASELSPFSSNARVVADRFALDERNVPAIRDICRRVDGLPLAIELAAAWVRILPSATLPQHLERRLPLLYGGTRDKPARLRIMRDAIAWSYDHLSPDETRLFRRLAIFAGASRWRQRW